MKKPPIFIVGSPRSGTTLLRFILSSHPGIYIPEETGFIPFLLRNQDLTKELSEDAIARILRKIAALNYLWEDAPRYLNELVTSHGQVYLADILDFLFTQKIKPHNAERWGDKTPLYVRYIPKIHKIFPKAQFIHMIRDGRDATLSAQKKWGIDKYFYMDNNYLLKNWVVNVRAGMNAAELLGTNQYFEVRYEDLVATPESTIKSLCDYLDEEFFPEMINHSILAKKVGPGPNLHHEVLSPISTSSIHRWKQEMDEFTQKLALRTAGSLLNELDYEIPVLPPFSIKEKLIYNLLALKYRILSSIRILLYRSGVITLNRTMRNKPDDK